MRKVSNKRRQYGQMLIFRSAYADASIGETESQRALCKHAHLNWASSNCIHWRQLKIADADHFYLLWLVLCRTDGEVSFVLFVCCQINASRFHFYKIRRKFFIMCRYNVQLSSIHRLRIHEWDVKREA